MRKIIDAHMHLPYRVEGLQDKKEQLLMQLERFDITYGIVISDSSLKSSIGSLTECVELFGDTDRVFVVGGISPLIDYANQLKILEKYIVLDVSRQYPNINFVCCHVNYPKVTECIQQLRDCQNVYFDLSSIADEYSVAMGFHKLLSQQIHEMPERFLFGSDYEGCDIKKHVDFIDRLDISDLEKQMVFYNNAKRIYRLDIMEDL